MATVGIRHIRGTDYPGKYCTLLARYGVHVKIIDARLDTPVLRNGTVEMASTDQ